MLRVERRDAAGRVRLREQGEVEAVGRDRGDELGGRGRHLEGHEAGVDRRGRLAARGRAGLLARAADGLWSTNRTWTSWYRYRAVRQSTAVDCSRYRRPSAALAFGRRCATAASRCPGTTMMLTKSPGTMSPADAAHVVDARW